MAITRRSFMDKLPFGLAGLWAIVQSGRLRMTRRSDEPWLVREDGDLCWHEEYFPIGYMMWLDGGNVPSGWAWADGRNGTEDMRSRFLDSHGNEICAGCNVIQRIA